MGWGRDRTESARRAMTVFAELVFVHWRHAVGCAMLFARN